MDTEINFKAADEKIQQIKLLVKELKEIGSLIPALDKNLVRISAILKMLELNISDIVQLDQ